LIQSLCDTRTSGRQEQAMSAIFLLYPIAFLALAAVVGVVLRLLLRGRYDDGGPTARSARRHESLVAWVAVVAGVATAIVLLAVPLAFPQSAPGALGAVTPLAATTVYALVRALGEATWPRPRGEVRVAQLARRTPWSIARARSWGVAISAAALVSILVIAGLTADATGRGITLTQSPLSWVTITPYPGFAYGVPLLVALAATIAATWFALATITRRRPLPGVPAAHDDAVRRTSAARLLAGVQLGVGVTLGAVMAVVGSAVANVASNVSGAANPLDPSTDLLGTAGMVLAVAGICVGLASLVVALLAAGSRQVRPGPHPTGLAVPGIPS
jgi:hypothetical protein